MPQMVAWRDSALRQVIPAAIGISPPGMYLVACRPGDAALTAMVAGLLERSAKEAPDSLPF